MFSYLDPTLGAQWRTTLIRDHAVFINDLASRGYLSPFWNIPGVIFTSICLALMHIGCLGILKHLLGNILFELFVRLDGMVTDWGPGVGRVLTFVKMAAKRLEIESPVWDRTLNMIKIQGKEPKFRTKATESRRMLDCVYWILTTFLHPRTPTDISFWIAYSKSIYFTTSSNLTTGIR